MVQVSKTRLDYLLKCEREVAVLQNEQDIERQRQRGRAKRTQYLVSMRLARVGEI